MSENPYREQIKNYLIQQFNFPSEQIDTMLPDLIATLADHIDRLEEVLQYGDPELLGKAGHTIKGALLNLGLEECADIALTIELSGKSGNDNFDYEGMVLSIREKLSPYIL